VKHNSHTWQPLDHSFGSAPCVIYAQLLVTCCNFFSDISAHLISCCICGAKRSFWSPGSLESTEFPYLAEELVSLDELCHRFLFGFNISSQGFVAKRFFLKLSETDSRCMGADRSVSEMQISQGWRESGGAVNFTTSLPKSVLCPESQLCTRLPVQDECFLLHRGPCLAVWRICPPMRDCNYPPRSR
jgi:hypothetical protein